MALEEPYPDLEELLAAIGEAGLRVSNIQGSEGGAGNISVYVGWPLEVRRRFPLVERIELPQPCLALAGGLVIVTGSGRRLRDIHTDPDANLGVVAIGADGVAGHLYTSPRRLFKRVSVEFNSHLAAHSDEVIRTGTNYNAMVHAQPPHIVYLSHIPAYRDEDFFNRQLMRWEPETIINLPEGIGVLPFMVPGSEELMEATAERLRENGIVVWSKHGVMARSDISVTRAADRIEYAEAAARYEYMDLANGSKADGITQDELREIVKAFNVRTKLVDG